MKNYITIKKYITSYVIVFCLLIITGCTRSMEDVNLNPYLLNDTIAKRDGYSQGAYFISLANAVIPIQENDFQFAEQMTGLPFGRYLPPTNSWGGQNFQTFNPNPSWNNIPFNTAFSQVYASFFNIQKLTNETGVNYAWAKILRVAAMQRITDMYGPIPYSKVKSGQLNAPYDSQQEVYEQMIKDLTDAVSELSRYVSASGNAKPMATYDKIYAGDFSKWIRFANSLKLRLAIRMVYADPVNAKKYAEEAVAAGVIEANSDNAAMPTSGKNPIYIIMNWPELRVSAELVSYMKGYKDNRISKYMVQNTYNNTTDYMGVRSGLINMNRDVVSARYSKPNISQSDPILWMPAAEVAFLRSEGALRSWNMGGTAESFYNTGIALSFQQWGATGAENYTQDVTSTQAAYVDPAGTNSAAPISNITIKWDETNSFERKLERIITQKWIAMFPLGLEAWSDYRRTKYPKFYPAVNNLSSDGVNSTLGAKRLVFPDSEYKTNSENVKAALGYLKGGDAMSTNLWWDSKN